MLLWQFLQGHFRWTSQKHHPQNAAPNDCNQATPYSYLNRQTVLCPLPARKGDKREYKPAPISRRAVTAQPQPSLRGPPRRPRRLLLAAPPGAGGRGQLTVTKPTAGSLHGPNHPGHPPRTPPLSPRGTARPLTAINVLLRPCCSPLAASASSPLAPVLSALPATAAAGGGGAGGGGAGGGCRCLPARLALACRQRWCRAKVCWRSSSRRSGETAW